MGASAPQSKTNVRYPMYVGEFGDGLILSLGSLRAGRVGKAG